MNHSTNIFTYTSNSKLLTNKNYKCKINYFSSFNNTNGEYYLSIKINDKNTILIHSINSSQGALIENMIKRISTLYNLHKSYVTVK
mgnify:CR=1 FL=1